jgi:hypothetical protein
MKPLIGLVLGLAAGTLVGPALATKLQWPVWLCFLVVAVDGFLLVDVPYQFSEFFATARLHSKGYGYFADGLGISVLLFILFGIAPIILLVWIVWQFIQW